MPSWAPARGDLFASRSARSSNKSTLPACRVLAVDLPSGLDCDTGQPLGPCVRAAHTATFVAPKRGFDAPGAAAFTGQVHVIDIGVPRCLLEAFVSPAEEYRLERLGGRVRCPG